VVEQHLWASRHRNRWCNQKDTVTFIPTTEFCEHSKERRRKREENEEECLICWSNVNDIYVGCCVGCVVVVFVFGRWIRCYFLRLEGERLEYFGLGYFGW
jgi:hypothetical protein